MNPLQAPFLRLLYVRAFFMNPVRALRARRILTSADAPSAARRLKSSASYLFDNAVLLFQGGLILAVEPYTQFKHRAGIPLDDAGEVTLIPGLINAHTHLELAAFRGKTLLGRGFCAWVESLLALKAQETDSGACIAAAEEMAENGTVHAGNVGKAPVDVAGAFFSAGVSTDFFCECFGFRLPGDAAELRAALLQGIPDRLLPHCALSGHALFSTHPRVLHAARQDCAARGKVFTMHLAEHEEETDCLLHGSGPLHELLRRRNILPENFAAPGKRPITYAHDLHLLDQGTLAVHCVHCDATETGLLAASGTAVCLCPRSNAAINTGLAPARLLADKGVLLCLGTDSPASNTDLNLWNEARALREAHDFPTETLLRMLTVNAAYALRRPELGRLAPGYRAAWAVLPPDFPLH